MGIQVKNLSFSYQEDTVFHQDALKKINFTVKDGELIGILGASGSGKSTLLQHLNGVIPSKDAVTVNGVAIGQKGVGLLDIVKNITMAFQYPEHQLFCDTVEQELRFGCENLGYDKETTDANIDYYLKKLGLSPRFLPRSPFHLSGGEKRRVALASIFAMNTPIVLLDEPTVGLDLRGKADFLKTVSSLHKETGKTILWVGHDIDEICKVATRLIVMSQGEVVLDATPREILENEDLLSFYGIVLREKQGFQTLLREKFGNALDEEEGKRILAFFQREAGGSR